MNLLVRLNVVFVIAFAVAGWVAYEVCASLQQADARREVLTTAELMLDSALASRGWQPNEVIGAQIVSVPFTAAVAGARRLFSGVTAVIVAVLAVLLVIVNITVYWAVVRPLRWMARQADAVSTGQGAGASFASGRNDEIGGLGEAFERMRKSLDKAIKMIGGPTRGA